MALRTRANRTAQVEFREISQTGVFLANTGAKFAESMELLRLNELRALTYQEALAMMYRNPELMKQLKGRWFYL